MNSFSDVIAAFGKQFADAIGVEESHARTMKARDSIPSTRWIATVSAAKRLGVKGVTLDLLARLDAEKCKQREAAQ
jgi:cellulase/cellobiase CelA1